MRKFSVLIVVLFTIWAPAALAQERLQDSGAQLVAPFKAAASEVDANVPKSVEDTRFKLRRLIEQSYQSVEKIAQNIHTSTGINGERAFGIAVGMVAGAVVVDMIGGSGLATIAVVAGGGFLGNWIMSD
jgi:hypothetical protein